MTDQVDQKVEDTNTQEQVEQKPALTPIEQKALDMGWRPREEFNGSDDDFIDAKEFVRRAPLFEKIEGQSKEIKSVKRALEALNQHYTKVRETEFDRALKALEEAKAQAVEDADGAAVVKLDKQIRAAEAGLEEVKQASQRPIVEDSPQVPPEFAAWENKNPWYKSVKYMRVWADELGVQLSSQGLSPREVLKKVEQAVREEFPDKFINKNKASAPDVESGSSGRGTQAKETFELTEQERKIMNTLVSTKQMTKEQYLADLKKIKGIK